MSIISIKRPIAIDMEVVEADSYLPSIKMAVKVEIIHPTGAFVYNANDIWFDCSIWDGFVASIVQVVLGNKHEALLKDMSDIFVLNITSKEETTIFNFKSQEVNVGEGIAGINFTSAISDDVLASIKEQFISFGKWW